VIRKNVPNIFYAASLHRLWVRSLLLFVYAIRFMSLASLLSIYLQDRSRITRARARALNFYGAEFSIHSYRSLAISPQMYSYEFISRLLELSWSYRKCSTMDAMHTHEAIQRSTFFLTLWSLIFFNLKKKRFFSCKYSKIKSQKNQ